MSDCLSNSGFDGQISRVKLITGTSTQVELARFLGIKQSSVSEVNRRKVLPMTWLLTLLMRARANPEWILTGKGAMFLIPAYKMEGALCDDDSIEDIAARSLPSNVLLRELVRRINHEDSGLTVSE